jgi:hypothetical protein
LSRLRLSDADRERLGCPEFLVNPLDTVTVREAIELQKLGYPTPLLFASALAARDEGPDFAARAALVWLALRRAGVESDPATLDFDIVGLQFFPDEEPAEPVVVSGKAPARGRSAISPTTRSTRGATSKARSTPTDLAS